MKLMHLIRTTAWVAAIMLTVACSSSKGLGRHSDHAQNEQTSTSRIGRSSNMAQGQNDQGMQAEVDSSMLSEQIDSLAKIAILEQVDGNTQTTRFITSKIKFSVEAGNRQMTLTGNLKMKRDDVIRLQLMAFGFVEAGRLEFTKDYVLIVDRINKQYLKVPYAHLNFLRSSKIDFYTLQALFWNEIYQPQATEEMPVQPLNAEHGADKDIILSRDNGPLSYRWLTEENTGRIKMSNILYSDKFRGNYQLNWNYEDFKIFERKYFPTIHQVSFTTPEKEVKIEMKLNYIGKDEEWETRTELSGKYRQMPIDDILRRFMSL